MTTRLGRFAFVSSLVAAQCSIGCGTATTTDPDVEKLTPEPTGAPTSLAEGRLTCLGNNKPAPRTSDQLVLPGWTRLYADPSAKMGAVAAKVEAFSETGASLGSGFADQTDGRVAVTVPISGDGFIGHLEVTHQDLLDYHFYTSRAYSTPDVAGWAWMMSAAELKGLGTNANVTIVDGMAVVAVGVHDCDGFGVGNAVVTVNGQTAGGVYVEDFKPAPARTFSAASGRVVFPNLAPGPATIKAFARTSAGGALILLSSIQVTLKANAIVAVDLQPRAGAK